MLDEGVVESRTPACGDVEASPLCAIRSEWERDAGFVALGVAAIGEQATQPLCGEPDVSDLVVVNAL